MKRYIFPNNKDLFINYNHNEYPELHCHMYWEFVLITEGSFKHLINGSRRDVYSDMLLVIRPNDSHALLGTGSYINLGVTESYLLHFLTKLLGDKYQNLVDPDYVEFKVQRSVTLSFVSGVQSLLLNNNNLDLYYDMLTVLFADMLNILVHNILTNNDSVSAYSPAVSEIIKKLRKKESFVLSIDEILQECNYSHSHIIRVFKKETGRTISQFFQDIKLNYAKNLLETSNMSISMISDEVGISNSSYFSYAFKKKFGVSPIQYRNNWQIYYRSFEEV